MTWTDPRTWAPGEVVTAAQLNTHLRDDLNALLHPLVRKSADESRTSTTTLTDDAEFQFTIGASEVWLIQFHLVIRGLNTAGIQVRFAGPTGCLPALKAISDTGGGAGSATWLLWQSLTDTGNFFTFSATVSQPEMIHGIVTNSTTAGLFKLQWAQQTSNATASKIMANSVLLGTRLV